MAYITYIGTSLAYIDIHYMYMSQRWAQCAHYTRIRDDDTLYAYTSYTCASIRVYVIHYTRIRHTRAHLYILYHN